MTIKATQSAYINPATNEDQAQSRQLEFNTGISTARQFGASSGTQTAGPLAASISEIIPNTQTEDARASLAGAIEAL